METTLPEMKVTGIMHFAGRPHLTYTLMDTDYFSLRPLVDQFGMDWRRQKQRVLDDESVLFYGTLSLEGQDILQNPCKYSQKSDVSASNCSPEPQKIATFYAEDAQKETVFIRLRRVQMYIARISLGHVKGTGGNHTSAEYILALHEEWAEALHDYETDGVAFKYKHAKYESGRLRDFIALCKEKRMTEDQAERKVLGSVMKDMAEKLGHPYQNELE